MNELRNSLGPLSQLVFANRNMVIIVLGAAVLLVTCYALIANWRVERLRRDLAETKTMVNKTPGRYTPRAQVAAEPVDQAGLPPIKGGRSYARNLGSALQKAGIPPPQPIYSPPVPGGWAPVPQTPAGTSTAPPPAYPPPSTPWGAPPAPSSTPWQFPGGPNRPLPPGQAAGQTQVPGYPAPAPAPSLYAPPVAPAQGPVIQSTPPFQSPGFAPPTPPAGAFSPPSDVQTEGEGQAPEQGRRGKAKRKRFNFAVREGLEKLEKMVQSKRAEPTTAGIEAPPPVDVQAAPIAPPTQVPAVQAVEPQAAAQAVPEAAPAETLPLQFEAPQAADVPEAEAVVAEPEAETAEPEAVIAEPEAVIAEPEAETAEPEAAITEPEPETVTPEPEPVVPVSPRQSMRSMLFGEEPVDSGAVETMKQPAAEPEVEPEPEPVAKAEVEEHVAETPTDTGEPAEAEPAEPPVVEQPAHGSVTAKPSWAAERDGSIETAPEPAAADTPPPVEVPTSRGESAGTVVIIEDDHSVAQYYAALFQGNGYKVEVANDGVSGVDLCTKVQPDVILLDVMMPRQNGILVLQTLRASEETRNTPVVVLSNFTEPTLIKRALQLGALEYVIKTQVEGPDLLEAMPHWMHREKAFAAAA